MSDKIYIVYSATGAYEDYCEIDLKAFRDRYKAEAEVAILEEAYIDWGQHKWDNEWRKTKPYQLRVDYTGIEFEIKEIEYE